MYIHPAYLAFISFVGIIIWFAIEVKKLLSTLPKVDGGVIKMSFSMPESNMASGTEYNKVVKNLEDATKLIKEILPKFERFCFQWITVFIIWGILFLISIYHYHPSQESAVLNKLDDIERLILEKKPVGAVAPSKSSQGQ